MIKAIKADITTLQVDAIVNAANSSLLGGGGVDGAIHRAAGHKLLQECETLNGCQTGDAKITKGYKLPAKFVIHAVGPVWYGGHQNESEDLASCYRKSLQLAVDNKCKSIAFPAISTGIYNFPLEEATIIAIKTVKEFLKQQKIKVTFCCFSDKDLSVYDKYLHKSFLSSLFSFLIGKIE
jgi:O-acetyl-ADP-ribose deacetylase (regulator of RNase III)